MAASTKDTSPKALMLCEWIDAGLAVEALQPVPRQEHGDQQRERGERREPLLGLHRAPGVREPGHALPLALLGSCVSGPPRQV